MVRLAGSEAGTTLIEMLIALGITAGVLGASGALAGQMQGSYRLQVETAEAQQEARYAIEWITRHLRSAGNNPYALAVTPCPVAGTPVMGIRLDPDGDGVDDDIRIQSDRFPANGLIGGGASNCTEAGEDVTISHDPATLTLRLQDNNLGGAPEPMTDALVGACASCTGTPTGTSRASRARWRLSRQASRCSRVSTIPRRMRRGQARCMLRFA